MKAIQYNYNGLSKTLEEWKEYFNSTVPTSTISKRLKNVSEKNFEKCFISNRFNSSLAKEYINKKIGKIKVLEYIGGRHGSVKCQCYCGEIFKTVFSTLVNGGVRSCGCSLYAIGKESPRYAGYEDISMIQFSQIKHSAIARNIEFSLSIEQIWDLFVKQNKKCAISGIDISLNSSKRHGEKGTASLDRINSSKGYIEGNIQWVHKDINTMKWDFTQEEFINYCKIIAKNN